MQFDSEFSDLVGLIYDCALDQSLWRSVLEQICSEMDAYMADLTVVDAVSGETRLVATFNMEEAFLEIVARNAHLHPLLPMGLVAPLGEPFCASRDVNLQGMHNSLYYRNCRLAERGQNDFIAVPLERTITTVSYWGVYNQFSNGLFADDHIAFARAVTPHIRRAVRISGMLAHGRVTEGTLQSVLAALPAAALIIDEQAGIRFANQAAMAELRTRRIVGEADNRLRVLSQDVSDFMQTLFADTKGHDILTEDSSQRRLHITGVRLDNSEEASRSYLILLRSPELELNTPIAAAARIYKLTFAEIQVLKLVVEGHSLAEAAAILGLARSTVKTHLDALYEKCEVNSRGKLAAKISGLMGPLGRIEA